MQVQAPVLVLNANYEPLNVCNIRRAIGLIQSDRATMVMNGRGTIQSINRSFPIPSIIRLDHMVTRPRQRVRLTRVEVFRRDHFTCQYCGRSTQILTIDHVIPRHMGGKHIWTNVVAACSACNHRKGGRTVADANMHLLHEPKEPPMSIEYQFSRHLRDNREWEPYLLGW
jgi:5-methylcytosine-specific restriction endonuclease McrA